MSDAQYPQDEFDQMGLEMPRGAHRPGQPWWHGVLPFVIAIILAPILAWIAFLMIGSKWAPSHDQSEATSSVTPSPIGTDESSAEEPEKSTPGDTQSDRRNEDPDPLPPSSSGSNNSPSASASPNVQDSRQGTDSPDVERNAESIKASSVSVQNASGISGLAAKTKDKLSGVGFSNVNAGNYTGTKPRQNTIYFKPGKEDAAKSVQQSLRIDMVIDANNLSSDVVVVLVKPLN